MSRPIVFRRAATDLHNDIESALTAVGGGTLARMRGRRVLIKTNLNSPHPFPATTSPDFLAALVEVLRAAGASRIVAGDSCGLRWAPASRVAAALGIPQLMRTLGAEFVNFDDGPWREVRVNGTLFPVVRIAGIAFEADFIVYACCMKTHPSAGFSLSLKHAVGFLPPDQRRAVHDGDVSLRIAEANLAVKPDMVLVDARKCFAAGGPAVGWVRRPGLLMASTDRIAADVEGIRILDRFRWFGKRRDPWSHPQIQAAVKLGLGVKASSEYDIREN